MYLALIADVIDSKMVQERLDLQKQVEKNASKDERIIWRLPGIPFYFDLGG